MIHKQAGPGNGLQAVLQDGKLQHRRRACDGDFREMGELLVAVNDHHCPNDLEETQTVRRTTYIRNVSSSVASGFMSFMGVSQSCHLM